MATPTQATDNVAHAAVGLATAIIVPLLIGKGRNRAVIAGIAGAQAGGDPTWQSRSPSRHSFEL